MKKILIALFLFISLLVSDTVTLKKGWNLIGIPSTLAATSLSSNPLVLSATGGGVGGGASFTFNKDFAQYANGNFILGQGYWIKVDADTTLTYTKENTLPSKVLLKKGWNLIHPFDTLVATELSKYPEILSATGGGVGGGASFTYNKAFAQYANGSTIPGQGYWINVSSDMELVFIHFDYRAWGIGGDDTASKAVLRLNGLDYTVLAYSALDIEQSNASISGDNTQFVGTILSQTMPNIKISSDYNSEQIKLKFFESKTTFDNSTLVYESDTLTANNSVVNYGNIEFTNPNDYSVPNPSDDSISMPPKSPTF